MEQTKSDSILIRIILLLIFFTTNSLIIAQTVTGKLVDQDGNGLSGLQLKLYISPKTFDAVSGTDGSFIFFNVTSVQKNDELPTGYSVSENYPNPFNPTTRIGISLPVSSNVQIELFNLLGQKVKEEIDNNYGIGTNFIDLELSGLSNGFYIARISIDGKYIVVRKLMLMYGSQHLVSSNVPIPDLNKSTLGRQSTLNTIIDSLEVTSTIIVKKTFRNLPSISGNSLDLGSLLIERFCAGIPSITYEGKIYNTLQIGKQCWLKENLDVGTMIQGGQATTDNGLIEKYCYNDDQTNCETYGGLYQWNEAMAYSTIEATKGICPTAWHVPTIAEWHTLTNPIYNNGNALLAIGQGNGTNISGFSALLSAYRNSNGTFSTLGFPIFFSSTEHDANYAEGLDLSINYFYYGKENGMSVRCIKDDFLPDTPILLTPKNNEVDISVSPLFHWYYNSTNTTTFTLQVSTSSSFQDFVYNQSGLTSTTKSIIGLDILTKYYWRVSATNSYGTSPFSNVSSFTTSRWGAPCLGIPNVVYEGKTYNTVQIGEQCWLRENLDVGKMIPVNVYQSNNGTIEKYCYDNKPENCETYGGLYMWNEAMTYSTEQKAKGICPEGWHIPTLNEFQTLGTTVNNNSNALKALGQGWAPGDGTNISGFSALLAGNSFSNSTFGYLGASTSFWSSTMSGIPQYVGRQGFVSENSNIQIAYDIIYSGYSIRCLKN